MITCSFRWLSINTDFPLWLSILVKQDFRLSMAPKNIQPDLVEQGNESSARVVGNAMQWPGSSGCNLFPLLQFDYCCCCSSMTIKFNTMIDSPLYCKQWHYGSIVGQGKSLLLVHFLDRQSSKVPCFHFGSLVCLHLRLAVDFGVFTRCPWAIGGHRYPLHHL